MDGKLGTFLLGVIAAVVLYMLWDHRNDQGPQYPWFMPNGSGTDAGAGAGCGSPCGGSAGYASPGVQAQLESTGLSGLIAPPGVPLGSPAAGGGIGSFYTSAGLTPDTSFTFAPSVPVPGSPTVPAATTPVRSLQSVAPYSTGFHQHYNIGGVPIKGYIQ